MAAGTDDKTASSAPTRPTQPYRPHQVDQGRGDMVSENRAANERFQRNSQVLQREQETRVASRAEQAPAGKPELTFAPDRQHGQNYGQLKQEQATAPANDPGQQQGAKRELSLGSDRQPNRQNRGQLRHEQSKAAGREQGEKKGLSFGPDREPGQDQSRGR